MRDRDRPTNADSSKEHTGVTDVRVACGNVHNESQDADRRKGDDKDATLLEAVRDVTGSDGGKGRNDVCER